MYNEELKKQFVRSYTTSINTAKLCESVFNQFEAYERTWNADLCTKSAKELQPIVDSIVGLRARSKYSRLIMLKDYVKWCMGVANVPNACDGMLQINTVGLDKIRHQTIASPLHLQKYLQDQDSYLFHHKNHLLHPPFFLKVTQNIQPFYHFLNLHNIL